MKSNIIKLFTLFTFVMPAFAVRATDFRTQDNVEYVVQIDPALDESNAALVATQIESVGKVQGNGNFQYMSRFRIVAVNLTSYGARRVSKLPGVTSIRLQSEMKARPKYFE